MIVKRTYSIQQYVRNIRDEKPIVEHTAIPKSLVWNAPQSPRPQSVNNNSQARSPVSIGLDILTGRHKSKIRPPSKLKKGYFKLKALIPIKGVIKE